ncbi:MAG: hypothetical protein MUD10_04455 [Candidatus Pacebacteria bacterium]|jgi:hypothetical protein|nr:hypothetical protein [Candidatus Paceibacterota bacterium]
MNKILMMSFAGLIPALFIFCAAKNVSGNSINMKTTLTDAATSWQGSLASSDDPQLQKLAEFEDRCDGAFSGMMVFQVFPPDGNAGRDMAAAIAKKVKEFAIYGVRPIVVVEPVSAADGAAVSFADIAAGKHDTALRTYFSEIKKTGVTDRQMGLWVPLPEPNTDSWGQANSAPDDFVSAYNRYGMIFKEYFPTADIGPLLDSETYLWDAGNTAVVPLDPYLEGVNKSLVDSFGLQGFPWPYVGAGGLETDYDAASFLPAVQAIDAAKNLGTKSVWFNTGTFSSFYIDGKLVFPLATGQRAQILETILGQLVSARDVGMAVSVNIFAQDKSGEDEGIDWSYWKSSFDSSSADGAALCDFTKRARSAGITLSVFDTK